MEGAAPRAQCGRVTLSAPISTPAQWGRRHRVDEALAPKASVNLGSVAGAAGEG